MTPRLLGSLALVVCAASLGCVGPLRPPPGAQLLCAGDDDCPAPLVCDVQAGRCLDPASGCVSVVDDAARISADGAACALGDVVAHCLEGVCVEAACGDGFVDPGEGCDFGSANSDVTPNACRSDCTLARCGDGVIDGGEECDASGEGCRDCFVVCAEHAGNCDGLPGCECTVDVIEGAFTAIAADDGGVWLAVADGVGTAVDWHPLGGPVTRLATFDTYVAELFVHEGSLVVRELTGDPFTDVASRSSLIDLETGALTPLVDSRGSIALRGDELVFVATSETGSGQGVVFRGDRNDVANAVALGEADCFDVQIGASETAGCDVAFRGDDVVLLDSTGSLFVSTANSDGFVPLVDLPAAWALTVVDDDVYWTSPRGLFRKRGDAEPEFLFAAPQKPAQSGVPNYEGIGIAPVVAGDFVFFAVWPTSKGEVLSVDLRTDVVTGRGAGAGPMAVADGLHWLDDILVSASEARHLSFAP